MGEGRKKEREKRGLRRKEGRKKGKKRGGLEGTKTRGDKRRSPSSEGKIDC